MAATTKEKIIFESLQLFSRDGFESSSTRAIARSVNCSDAVIYKHFGSKQEILDAITEICTQRILERSGRVRLENMCWKDVEQICLGMFEFQTTDEWIVPFRRMLVIEQFKNETLGQLYSQIFIDGPLDTMETMFEKLIELGYMKPGNPRVYAMDLYAPFFMYHTIGGSDEELLATLKEHVTQFRRNVVTDLVYLESDSVGL